jgi:cell division protein ZapB
MAELSLKDLETKLDQLISQCQQLDDENTELKQQQEGWELERTRLTEKNEQARSRVEAMIDRLKSLESRS